MSQCQFVWYDVMTTDMKAAESFYQTVIGWRAQDSGMSDRPYTLLSAGPAMVGGIMPIPEDVRAQGARPAWTGYVGVDDVDAFAKRIGAKGGTVHRGPQDIPGVGRFCVVADPQGAVFILFRGSSAPSSTAVDNAAPGHIGWHELHAADGATAWGFYADLFGWTTAGTVDMGPMGSYQIFAMGGQAVGGMMTKGPEVPMPFWLYYINVDALDSALARMKTAGGQLLNGPMEVPGGSWIAQCTDPQGAMFALVSPKR